MLELDMPRPPKAELEYVQCRTPCEVDTEEVAKIVQLGEEGLLEPQMHGFKGETGIYFSRILLYSVVQIY